MNSEQVNALNKMLNERGFGRPLVVIDFGTGWRLPGVGDDDERDFQERADARKYDQDAVSHTVAKNAGKLIIQSVDKI